MLMLVFPNILLEGAETIIAMICQEKFEYQNEQQSQEIRVKCRGNIELDSKQKSVLFQPLIEPNISDILNINKLYENLSKGKTPHILITIANPSNKDIIMNKGDILGTLHNVLATIPVIYTWNNMQAILKASPCYHFQGLLVTKQGSEKLT